MTPGIEVFNNIPDDFKSLPNWILWRYENINGAETKVPYNPHTGRHANINEPLTWGSFDKCLSVLPESGMTGLGFVITPSCYLTCIDVDNPYKLNKDGSPKYDNPEQLLARQIAVSKAFNTYQEISPSGKGLHIWLRGSVPSGRDRYSIGLYPSGRYMTMTGQVFNPNPIAEYPDLLHQLWAELGPPEQEIQTSTVNEEQSQSDDEILTVAGDAINGMKFRDLWEGNWEVHYPSQSEADFALIDILAYYTQNRIQIIRMFRNSGLGRRKKALRADYCEKMLNRSFDNQLTPIDLSTLQESLRKALAVKQAESVKEQGKAVKQAVTVKKPSKDVYTPPPGLIGELAAFIYQAAPRPVPEIALAAAIGLMAGVCGKSYNISGTGLNQYILLLAPTGTGKESMSSGVGKIMSSILTTVPACVDFIGPGEISSPQALIKYMDKKSSCFMSLVGEFGLMLKQISSARANPIQVGIRRVLLDLYNKSGASDSYKPIIYSDKDKNTQTINSPAFTMLGESTPERFYETLTDEMIYEGLLPRFTIIEYLGKRPQLNKKHLQAVIPNRLVEQFGMLCAYSLQLNNSRQVINVDQDEETKKCFEDFDKKCDSELNLAHNEITRHLWNRGHVKALKLAGLLAVGTNYINPCVSIDQALWAIRVIESDIENLLTRFEAGDIGTPQNQNKQLEDLKKAFGWYLKKPWKDIESYPGATEASYKAKVVPHSFLTSVCRSRASFKQDRIGPVQALKTLLMSLTESGDIQELAVKDKEKNGIGKNGKIYCVINPKSFL